MRQTSLSAARASPYAGDVVVASRRRARTTQVAQIYPTLLSRSRQTCGEVHCLIEGGRTSDDLLAHVAKDGVLCPRRDQGVGAPLNPDSSAATIAALLACDSLQSEDAIGTREHAEPNNATIRESDVR